MAEQSSPASERITVTFAASQPLLAAPLTPHFIDLLQQQLPLRNLHWRPSQSTLDAVAARAAQQGKPAQASSSLAPGSTIRTIQTLDVALKPLTDEIRRWRGDPGYFEQPGGAGLLDRPFVHLYLVVCEDSEHYRTTVRNEIRSWISSLSFFHARQPGVGANNPAPGTPTLASSSRTSLGLGSLRSATPPVRSDTPPATASGPQTPTTSAAASKATLPASISIVPTEPEYLIVLITPPEGAGISGLANATPAAEAKTGMGRFMNKSKANVLEKARADFSTSKKEHVVHISRLPPVPAVPLTRSGLHSMDPTIWAELLTKMREAASATFTTTIEAQEHEIARCGVTKGQQGWDFCSYFLAKDSLARTLDAVGLKDDAVGQYEDLEIVFAQAMQTGAVAFAPIGGDGANDDSLPLLDVHKKPYAELIRRNDISLFDFRCYLFARKSALLGKMGRVAAVMREAPLFIAAVGRMLRRNPRLGSEWIESWIFSAALDVVEQCQAWLIQRSAATSDQGVDQLTPAFQSNKSELLDLARRQLDRIGIQAGHLPELDPFVCPSDGGATDTARNRDLPALPDDASGEGAAGLGPALQLDEKRMPSRPELKQAIESREHFDSHYLALCERIAAGWKAASRHRDTLHVRLVMAMLRYLRADYAAAHTSLCTISDAYATARFSLLEAHALALQLECHAQLGLPRDRAWVAAALAVLRASVQTRARAQIAGTEAAKWTDPAYVCDELRRASSAMEREIPVSGFPLFAIVVPSGTARLVESEDGSVVTVDVTSMLPCAQLVQDVRMCVVGKHAESLWYTSGSTTLQPGRNRVELFNAHPAHGVYTVDVTQIRLARLIFQYDAAAAVPTVVRVPKDGAAPSVALSLPRRIHLDRTREVQVTVRAGRHRIDSVEVRVGAADGTALVDYSSVVAQSEAPATEAAADWASLTTLRSDEEVRFTVPLLHVPESGLLDAVVTLSYISAQGERALGKKRVLTMRVQLRTALPLGVNVQDFFRTASLLSKFTISAAGAGSIRLQPVRLDHDGDAAGTLEITACGSARQATVTPRQPATYLFRMVNTARPAERGRLRLTVNYRSLHEEAVSLAVGALQTQGWGMEATRLVQQALRVYVGERVDLPAFSITGGVRTGEVDAAWWRTEWRTWGQAPASFADVLATVTRALDAVASAARAGDVDDTWQTLTIPVDVPSVEYVNAVTLNVGAPLSDDTALVVGQPAQLTVAITVSRQWATSAEAAKMIWDVVPDFETWLVDGQKRGSFAIAASEQEASVTLTLTAVPLRTGAVALPHVVVHPLLAEHQQASCETYITNAAQRITILPAPTTTAFFLPTSSPVPNTVSQPASYESAMWLPYQAAQPSHARA
ncbi:putative transmembrane protein [Moesziomyces antarcticus T-34]|uniref:Putative transmembrane protein n=1 Tax=Pseudozyma antarctica (strain T-34) TaxID=1151754 RepID=M9LLA1_PSEA3|nr:putative transmembrane protein [Moesziomyces antarcticus T-34]